MSSRSFATNVKGKNVCFLHIPKTGGQSVQAVLGMGLRLHLPVRDETRVRELAQCDFAFAFIRSPYTRAVSLFNWLAELHKSPTKRRAENAALNQWCKNTDVSSFWKQVDVEYLNKQTGGNMFRQQSWFLTTKAGILHPKVVLLRFEKMEEEWARACELMGIQRPLPKRNASKPSGTNVGLDEEARARVASLYSKDFNNFYGG